jgi:tRNA threonylcarbamoyladenosine biosynthesis protein TsaB
VRVLAVDTTTAQESVAVVRGGTVLAEVRLAGPSVPSRRLVPAVAFLLDSLGLGPEEVEAYAVTRGPGSFTGLRVGLATVQGLALASGRPCFQVSALAVLAHLARGAAERIVAVRPAERGEHFLALHDQEGRPIGAPVVGPLAEYAAGLRGAAYCGVEEDRRAEVRARDPGALFPACTLFLAAAVGLLAEGPLTRGEGLAAADLRPLYVRDPLVRVPRP